ncbi:MAG: YIP1 family protein [Candidatus Micrarchaeota archaeon]|nr:YIP1 family protein [Candidatus Micrarchaeota archaeon]
MGIEDRLNSAKEVFFSPESTFASLSKQSFSFKDGLINFLISSIFFAFAIFIYMIFAPSFFGSGAFGFPMAFIVAVVAAIVVLVFFFVHSGLTHAILLLFGGKGSFSKMFYFLSLISIWISAVVSAFLILFAILSLSIAGLFLMLVLYPLLYSSVFYQIYQTIVALKTSHNVSSLKATFSYIIAASIIVFAIMMALFGVALLGMTSLASSLS